MRKMILALATLAALMGVQSAAADDNKCAERVVAQMNVPDGDVSYTVDGKKLVFSVRHDLADGLYSIATAEFRLAPGVKVSVTDRGTVLTSGKHEFVLQGIGTMDALAAYLDLANLKLFQEGPDIGFTLPTNWKYEMKNVRSDSAHRAAKPGGLGFRGTGTGGPFAPVMNNSATPRIGFQWRLSPLLVATINKTETLKLARVCVRDLYVARTSNPPVKVTTTSQSR